MKEANRQALIQIEATESGAVTFRNNTGMGWQGRIVSRRGNLLILEDPRPLHAGLTTGSSDLIGWKTIEVTEQMIGQQLAIFTAIEVKSAKGRPTKEQLNFIEQVLKAGGLAGVARAPEDLKLILP